jgi:predicted porin
MKHQILALCAAGACAGPAWAQSSVTIFGVMDMAARHVDNQGVGSIQSLVSGSNSTSRLGFRGSEDLGGGLSAGFHLEHGILADTGTQAGGNLFWDRRSTLSLTSRTLGELRLGRDFVPTYVGWSRYDPFSYVGVARTANLVSATPLGPINSAFSNNANTTVRASNAVQWLLPRGLGGFEGGLMVAAGEGGSAAAGAAKLLGGRIGYAAGPFGISVATATTENSLTTAGKFKDHALGAHYAIGPVKLSAAWRRFEYDTARQTLLLVGAVASFGAHDVKASWTRADMAGSVAGTGIGGNDADQLGLGYVYNLSKRTAAYGSVARISNKGAARFVIPGGPAGLGEGGDSTGLEFGLRHSF